MIDSYRPADNVSAMRAEIVSKFVDGRKGGLLASLESPVVVAIAGEVDQPTTSNIACTALGPLHP
jgi:hypothetical protein